ncbi:GTPase HflX [Pontibacter sp. G13]|uniref:GTPase HflX n=1 Tax=Pontibacter sp. G13 TaxID=3074898 RepID=UPI002889CA10|nr:GTPase HflX [Pontibacter sp. G13]WNJ21409.1 GTPase HflX [Pontibacter sp. G13]
MIERTKISGNEEERAILIGVCSRGMTFEQSKEYLDELAFLTETAGAKAVRSFIQKLDKPINSTYIGSGKIEEVKQALEEANANMVIVDDDLSPSQIRNLDKELEVKVLDRSSLILHIFSERAQTAQARTQVDLAQYQYLLPRLTGMWTHLSRQKGGIGLKGAGEKEIETDRRIIRERISHLRKQLVKIDRQEETRRKNRSNFARVALVGYTNVGKSTIMNVITKANVLAENKLFATLDTTVRKVSLSGIPFLLSDTVGFIRKLPHHLIESFKSTLAETQESDILIHVVDSSHPNFEDQIRNVNETLKELEITSQRVLTVFNKIDLLDEDSRAHVENSWMTKDHQPAVCISARNKENLDDFRQILTDLLVEVYQEKSHGSPHPFLQQYQYYQMTDDATE